MQDIHLNSPEERQRLGIPPLPLDTEETRCLCQALVNPSVAPGAAAEEQLRRLAARVPPGIAAAAKVKADFLAAIASGTEISPLLTPEQAVQMLGDMPGGWNVPYLIRLLDDVRLAPLAAESLKKIIFIFDRFSDMVSLMKRGNRFARRVLESWAAEEWFHALPPPPAEMRLTVFRVEGEVNTDDLSPARHAGTRADIPLHALCMGESRFPGGITAIASFRAAGKRVAFAADILGTGSSRKSAANSLIWHIGDDIPGIPNKRRGGVVLAEQIAPIFFNTLLDAGCLAIKCEAKNFHTGQEITLHLAKGRIYDENGKSLARFKIDPPEMLDAVRAGGRLNLLIGRKLTAQAQEVLGSTKAVTSPAPQRRRRGRYTLAQKMVGRACGKEGVKPGESCEPHMTTVGSQDTTGPMTREELIELSCLGFQADLVMQSFCHTAAYPTPSDQAMHESLSQFMRERGGIALKPGDGIIHSWLNRMLLPDTVGTGGDSHTRFPLGISFPAGSGLVAFAAALGSMPLEMPESVLVRLSGALRPGVFLRDVVNYLPLVAMAKGLLSPPGKGAENIFNSRIIEFEGMPHLTLEEAFELTCASAERSAAAATVALGAKTVCAGLESNLTALRRIVGEGYQSAATLRRRIAGIEEWLKNPVLLERDKSAEFSGIIDLRLDEIREPVLACPNNPDNVAWLAAIAGQKVDEVFIGSCMITADHLRAAAAILKRHGKPLGVRCLWVAPPTRLDMETLEREGVLACFRQAGGRVEIPGCSLCMGNQARVADNAVVVSTSTRNFDNRMGKGAQVYLASSQVAMVSACLGRIPTWPEYANLVL